MTTPTTTTADRFSAPPWLAIVIALAVMGIAWRDGISHLVGVWLISPTYTHGLIVIPLSIFLMYLGWRRGEGLAAWPLALLGVVPAAIAYGVGTGWDLRLAQHVGIAIALMALISGLLGRAFSTRHRFAILFLLAMIPVGDGLLPALQLLTAHGIMAITELFGVPAIRNGTVIDTDAGQFLVEEGCAGLRFLIASAVTGVFGAHLFYRRRARQIGFVMIAILVPILANIARAASVVLVATWSDMKHATGFDHVVFGWGLFSIIMGIILIIGIITAEPDAPSRPAPAMVRTRPIPAAWLLGVLAVIISAGLI